MLELTHVTSGFTKESALDFATELE